MKFGIYLALLLFKWEKAKCSVERNKVLFLFADVTVGSLLGEFDKTHLSFLDFDCFVVCFKFIFVQ